MVVLQLGDLWVVNYSLPKKDKHVTQHKPCSPVCSEDGNKLSGSA